MNQSQFLAITCNSLEAREKARVHGAIGFGFASHWLKNWRESFEPITKRSNLIGSLRGPEFPVSARGHGNAYASFLLTTFYTSLIHQLCLIVTFTIHSFIYLLN